MKPSFKEINSSLLSIIVFLNLLLYHIPFKQSSLCRVTITTFSKKMPGNRLYNTDILKIQITDFKIYFQNQFLFLLLKCILCPGESLKIRHILNIITIIYISVYAKKFVILLLENKLVESAKLQESLKIAGR
jgi:hypothetical protein